MQNIHGALTNQRKGRQSNRKKKTKANIRRIGTPQKKK